MKNLTAKLAVSHQFSMLLLITIVVTFAGYTILRDFSTCPAKDYIEQQFLPVARLEHLYAKLEELEKTHHHSDEERRKLDRQFLTIATSTDDTSERMAHVLVKFGHIFNCSNNDQDSLRCVSCLKKASSIFSALVNTSSKKNIRLIKNPRASVQVCKFVLAEKYRQIGNLEAAELAYSQAFSSVPIATPVNYSNPNYHWFQKYATFLEAKKDYVEAGRLRLRLDSNNKFEIPPRRTILNQMPSCLNGRWKLAFFGADTGGDLILVLQTSGNKVFGRYLASERVEFPYFATQDTLDSETPSILGEFKNGVAKLMLRTNAGHNADLTLVRIGQYLVWSMDNWQNFHVSDPPSLDPYAIPFSAILKRDDRRLRTFVD